MLKKKSGSTSSVNTAIRLGVPTIMLPSSDSRHVFLDALEGMAAIALLPIGAVFGVRWSSVHGDSETLTVELWKKLAPDIFQVTS